MIYGVKSNLEKKRPYVESYLAALDEAKQWLDKSDDAAVVQELVKFKTFSGLSPDYRTLVAGSIRAHTHLGTTNGYIFPGQ